MRKSNDWTDSREVLIHDPRIRINFVGFSVFSLNDGLTRRPRITTIIIAHGETCIRHFFFFFNPTVPSDVDSRSRTVVTKQINTISVRNYIVNSGKLAVGVLP